jgi:hypothetical protein
MIADEACGLMHAEGRGSRVDQRTARLIAAERCSSCIAKAAPATVRVTTTARRSAVDDRRGPGVLAKRCTAGPSDTHRTAGRAAERRRGRDHTFG